MTNETIEGIKRLSWLPDRDAAENGNLIGGQEYYDVEFTGGSIANVTLTDVTINGSSTTPTQRIVTAPGPITIASDDYTLIINQTVAAAISITLSGAQTAGRRLEIKDGKGDASTNNITLTGVVDGTTNPVINTNYGARTIEYNTTNSQWNVIADAYTTGNVQGPVSSTDNAIARFDGATGQQIQNSGVIVDDSNNVTANSYTSSASTASRIASFDSSKVISSLDTATYPSLTELSYVKGVTSAIQTQMDGKQATGNYITAITGEVTASGPGSVAATVTNSAVIGKVLTGYTSGAGTVASTDSILQAIQKLNGNTAALTTGVSSVFSRTGAVTAQSGDYTATQVGLGSVTNDAQTKASIVPNTAPTAGQILAGNAGGTAYAPVSVSGAITLSSAGAATIATPGTLAVGSTNSTATAHTHAITSSSAPGAAAAILATDASGVIGSTGTRIEKIWVKDITVTNAISGSVTTNANLTGPITSVGNATAIASGNTYPAPTFSGTTTPQGLVDISGASAGQIKFPATQNPSADANTLDDYEEGNWTPADGSSSSLSITVNSATYTKIGRAVFIQCSVTYPVTVSSNLNQLSGLPFTVLNFATGANIASAAVAGAVSFRGGTTNCQIRNISAAAQPTNATLSTSDLTFGGVYFV